MMMQSNIIFAEYRSYKKPKERAFFYKDLDTLSFKKMINKYVRGPLWKRVGRKVKYILMNHRNK